MDPALIIGVVTGLAGLITAIGAVIHNLRQDSRQVRRDTFETWQAEVRYLRDCVTELRLELRLAEARIDELETENVELTQALRQAEARISELETENQDLKRRLGDVE